MMRLSRCKTLYKAVSWIVIFTFLFTIWGGTAIPVLASPSGAVSSSVYRDVYTPGENNDDSPADALNSIDQAPATEKVENEGQTASAPADELSASAPVITLSETGNNSHTNPANDAVDSAIITEKTTDAAPDPATENASSSYPKENVPSSKANTPESKSSTTLIFDGYHTIATGSSDIDENLGSLSNSAETVNEDVYEEDNQNRETENGVEDDIKDAIEDGSENGAEDNAEGNIEDVIKDDTNGIIEEADPEQPLTMIMQSGEPPITPGEWYFDPEIITSHNMEIWFSASFTAIEELTAIDYYYTQDGVNWSELTGPIVLEEWMGGLYKWEEDGAWWQHTLMMISGIPQCK
jgi:hypothetical protein